MSKIGERKMEKEDTCLKKKHGRIPKSVFARHYLKVDDVKELVNQSMKLTLRMEDNLAS